MLLHGILIIQYLALVHGQCMFPTYTVKYLQWESKISQERHVIGAYWAFNQSTAEFIDLTKTQTSYVYRCEEEVSSNTFLIKLIPKGKTDEQALKEESNLLIYRCAQFFKHSNSLLQLNLSPLQLFGPKEILCAGNNAAWDSQVLVWPRIQNYEASPIIGGFQFSMTEHSTGVQLCANSYLPPVLESECMEEESINIDFRNFYCRGDLGMQLNQRLYCLGSWREGNFTFSVTTDQDETWPRLWLLRFPSVMKNEPFNVEIFRDIKVINTENIDPQTDYYTMHLTRKSYLSTCEDEAIQCRNCNDSIVIYCLKSCRACHNNQPGNISNNTVGSWIQFSSGGTKNVTITNSSMAIEDITFSFLGLEMNSWYKTKDRKVMTITFNNGCRPRYLCTDFVRQGDSVLQYRLSQYVPWPQAPSMNGDSICNENLFTDSKSWLSTSYGSHKYKAIVTSNEPRQNTSCGLGQGQFHLIAHFPTGKTCKVIINSCRSQSELNLTSICMIQIGSVHKCLATFTDDVSADLVTITEDVSTSVAYCWVLHKDEWESRPRLFLTYAADCHSDVAKYILYRNYTGYLAYFDIVAGPGLLGSYSCLEDPQSFFNTFSTVTPSTISTTPSNFHKPGSSTKHNQVPDNVENNVQQPIRNTNHGNVNLWLPTQPIIMSVLFITTLSVTEGFM